MYFAVSSDTSKERIFDLIAYPIKTSWDANDVSWADMASQLNDSFITTGVVNIEVEEIPRLNLTHIIQAWVDGTFPNYGLLIISLQDPSNQISFEQYPVASPTVEAMVKIYYTTPKKR